MTLPRRRRFRRTGSGAAAVALVAAGFTAPVAAATIQDDPIERLLRLHHHQRVAHVLGDAGALTDLFAPELVELNRGRVAMHRASALRQRFADYFGSVRFLEWEDVRPPRIRFSADGAWAEVIVEKRVRTIPVDTMRTRRQGHTVFAWLERWVRTDSGWRLSAIASTERPGTEVEPATLAERVRAYEILRRAREAVGGEEAVARIATLRFVADCEGPNRRFTTTVASARDGRVSLVQEYPEPPAFAAGVTLAGAWHGRDDEPGTDSLSAVLATILTGHEMHLLAIGPEARFTAPVALPPERTDGRDAHVVRFRDALGAPADFLYDAETGRPLGVRLVNHTGRGAKTVFMRFSDWRRVGDVLLPFAIAITHGKDLYRYKITEATTDWLTDAAFGPEGDG